MQVLQGKRRFKPSELTIAKVEAILSEYHWLEGEARLTENGAIEREL